MDCFSTIGIPARGIGGATPDKTGFPLQGPEPILPLSWRQRQCHRFAHHRRPSGTPRHCSRRVFQVRLYFLFPMYITIN